MSWEKLYVAEHDMAFRFFAHKEANRVPFQFFLICTQQGRHGLWEASLAQEDPQNCETEIRIANRAFEREHKGLGIERLQLQALGVILWATNFINRNYGLSIPAIAPDDLSDELYQPK